MIAMNQITCYHKRMILGPKCLRRCCRRSSHSSAAQDSSMFVSSLGSEGILQDEPCWACGVEERKWHESRMHCSAGCSSWASSTACCSSRCKNVGSSLVSQTPLREWAKQRWGKTKPHLQQWCSGPLEACSRTGTREAEAVSWQHHVFLSNQPFKIYWIDWVSSHETFDWYHHCRANYQLLISGRSCRLVPAVDTVCRWDESQNI